MYHDLCLPSDDVDALVNRDRLYYAVSMGYESAAAVQTVANKLTEADRCSLRPVSSEALQAAGSSHPLLHLKGGLTATTAPLVRPQELASCLVA